MMNAEYIGQGLIDQKVMMMANQEFMQNLPKEIRNLIAHGVYSLYSLESGNEFLIITDAKNYFLVDGKGVILKKLNSLDGVSPAEAIMLDDDSSTNAMKVNYA